MKTITYTETLKMWLLKIRSLLAFVINIILKLLEVKCGMAITNVLEIGFFLTPFIYIALYIYIHTL